MFLFLFLFFKYCADVENYGASKGFGYIYIYIYIDYIIYACVRMRSGRGQCVIGTFSMIDKERVSL